MLREIEKKEERKRGRPSAGKTEKNKRIGDWRPNMTTVCLKMLHSIPLLHMLPFKKLA